MEDDFDIDIEYNYEDNEKPDYSYYIDYDDFVDD